MVARLWWKDARQFWSIWVLLAVVGLAVQGLSLHYLGKVARNGDLAVMALCWTCLYAFAIAVSAFAGERENRTLHLLDALPVDRWRIWTGKVSFAVVSTFALGILLFLAAALATDNWERFTPWWGLFSGATVLFVVLGCGLFWSAVMSNTLLAAVLSVFTALLLVPALDAELKLELGQGVMSLYQVFCGVVGLGAFVLAVHPVGSTSSAVNPAQGSAADGQADRAGRRGCDQGSPATAVLAGGRAEPDMADIPRVALGLVVAGLALSGRATGLLHRAENTLWGLDALPPDREHCCRYQRLRH